ncbi:DUF4190 domain-containing protein [Streptomyces sp. NPDC002044]|uniref:DUF4190 domain-containing protein n=1 Tax=Streptomyces sp. NPDC002044 TaxID=3154662 RepID=UPI00331D53BE
MTGNSQDPRGPWAPPERPAVDLGKTQDPPAGAAGPAGAPGVTGEPGEPGVRRPPSGYDHPTLAGTPGDAPPTADTVISGPGASGQPVYGYPAQPGQGTHGYGHPAAPGYGYPGDAGYPGPAFHSGSAGYPPFGPSPYGRPPSNGFGITALVLGIAAVLLGLFGCFVAFVGLPLGIAAVVFGVLGRGKALRGEADNGGMALAGVITGAVGIVVAAVVTALFFGVLAGIPDGGGGDDGPYSDLPVSERV